MVTAIDTRKTNFSEMDNAGISREHWRIMLISGMGFLTDTYDLFIIHSLYQTAGKKLQATSSEKR